MNTIPALFAQESISDFINSSIRDNRIPHAVIIKGPPDGGGLDIAEYFAGKISADPDIRVVDFDDKAAGYIKTIREQVVENLILRPYRNDFKVYIIKNADEMTDEAQNALLKSLEEPPEYAVILLLCENPRRLLPTIRSRTIELSIRPLESSRIRDYLTGHMGIDPQKAALISQLCGGNLSKAIMLCEDNSYREMARDISRVMEGLTGQHGEITLDFREEMDSFSQNMDIFLELMEMFLRDVLVYKLEKENVEFLYSGWKDSVAEVSTRLSLPAIGKISKRLKTINKYREHNAGTDTVLDILFNEIPKRGDRY